MSSQNKDKVSCPKGLFDILPSYSQGDTWKKSFLWDFLEKKIRSQTLLYNYQEIRTPIFERVELFKRSVGEETDIVSKEMYTFCDRKNREYCLRPEGTASVARAFIEHQLKNKLHTHKLFYLGPMFRYERQQKGRYRQHHQFGVEALGPLSPALDAELIEMLYSLYQSLGLNNLTIHLNSLGDANCRKNYRKALIEHLIPYKSSLSADSQRRLENNPLRVLDSKSPEDQEAIEKAPSLADFYSAESRLHFETVCAHLKALNIPYTISSRLVRGLDYYSETVFEITSHRTGAQNSLGGGGRYNQLISDLGGQETPGVGFATGLERVLQAMLDEEVSIPLSAHAHLYLIPLGSEASIQSQVLAKSLRMKGLRVELDYSGKKLKQILPKLEETPPLLLGVIGDTELKEQTVELKDWKHHTKEKVAFLDLASYINRKLSS